ncbi:MAG: hypothetical protein U5J83_06065 [Bryobacterales bacterium]|nr:hypothetical protein [Bryobacterales bacterium]
MNSNTFAPAFNWNNTYPGVVQSITPGPSLATAPVNAWGPVSWDPDGGRVGYAQQWNLNIQRELPGNMVFDIGYVGSKNTAIRAMNADCRQIRPDIYDGDPLNEWFNSAATMPAAVKAAGGVYPFGNTGEWMPGWQALTPFPQLATWNTINSAFTPLGFSTYHALRCS